MLKKLKNLLIASAATAGFAAIGGEINVFPDGNFENQKIVYRMIGTVRGSAGYDSERVAEGRYSLKVASFEPGNVRGYSGQVIQLNQTRPVPLTVTYKGMRQGTGKTLAAVDLVVTYDNGQRTYFFRGLELTGDTNGKWIAKKAVFTPARPIKTVEVWPIVNGDPCTAWFDDIRIMTEENASGATSLPTVPANPGQARPAAGGQVNVFPDGNFENQKIVYRMIGTVRGSAGYDSEHVAEGRYSLKVASFEPGNVRGYSGQVISLNQTRPVPLTITYKGMRRGTGKTLAAVDLVVTYDNGQRTYFFRGLELTGDTNGKWIARKAIFTPARPIKTVEVWPIVNGDPCTAWFDDIRIMTDRSALEAAAVRETVIDRGNLRMTFGDFGKFFNLVELENKNGKKFFVRKSARRVPDHLWSIRFRLSGNRIVAAEQGKISEIISSEAKNKYFFLWNDLPIPDSPGRFSVKVTLDLTDDLARWYIEVQSSEDIFDVAFPRLNGIGQLGRYGHDDFAVIPDRSGVLMQDYSRIGTVNLTYGAGCSMQFFAFYDRHGGMYVATHDASMLAKNFQLSRQLDNSLNFSVSTIPGLRRNYQQPFPFVMRFFDGDWFDAAQIYRDWATRQSWCRESGRLIDRKNPLVDEIHAWIKGGAINAEPYTYPVKTTAAIDRLTPEERLQYAGRIADDATARELIRLADAIGRNSTAVWFTDNWHTGGCCGITPTSPEYQARRGFREMNEILRQNGVSVVPYVNFGRYDTVLASYSESGMMRNADFKVRTYPAHGIQQGAICHASSSSAPIWNELASRIASYGCAGIYLDELSTNGNPVCYAENHDHTPGDSAAKMKAQRSDVIAMKKAAAPGQQGFFTMGEQGAEVYIGANDVNIWWKSSEGDDDIPLFEAVYHDYAVGMGRIPGKWYGRHMERGYPDARGDVGMEEFMLNVGKAFVHGLQLGIVRQDMLAYSPSAVRHLASMTALRKKLIDHLYYGQLLRAPRLLHPREKISVKQSFNGFVSVLSAPILSGAFQAQDGSVATVFLNITDKELKFNYSVAPVDQWHMAGGNYELVKITPDGEETLGVLNTESGKSHTFSLTIGANAPAAVIWRKRQAAPTEDFGTEKVPEDKLAAEVYARSTQIRAGDSIFFDGRIGNPTGETHTLTLEWKLPPGWQAVGSSEKISVHAGEEARFVAEIRSRRSERSAGEEIRLSIPELGAEYQFRIEQRPPRREFAVYPAREEIVDAMRDCTYDLDAEPNRIKLVPPERGAREKLASADVCGVCRYDRAGLHFLFRVEGVPHFDAPDNGDIWKGCCMQFAFDGKRLNQSYAISLAAAKTASRLAVWDFLTGKNTDMVKFNWKNTGNAQYYYLFVPWKNFGDELPVGRKISFSATYNQSDGAGFAGYLEWTKGICGGTLPNEYGDLLICR